MTEELPWQLKEAGTHFASQVAVHHGGEGVAAGGGAQGKQSEMHTAA